MENQHKFITFGAPKINEPEIDEVVATLRSGWLGTGPRVARFEKEFAEYKGLDAKYAAAVNSCTAALHVSMVAAKLDPGAEVITTPLTFCATVNAILHAGLTPVLADVDPQTQCIDPAAIEAAITPRTQAILPVHFAGRSCDMDKIMAIAEKHRLRARHRNGIQGTKSRNIRSFRMFQFLCHKECGHGRRWNDHRAR